MNRIDGLVVDLIDEFPDMVDDDPAGFFKDLSGGLDNGATPGFGNGGQGIGCLFRIPDGSHPEDDHGVRRCREGAAKGRGNSLPLRAD